MYNVFFDGNDAHPELKEIFLVTKLLVTLDMLGVKSAGFYVGEQSNLYPIINEDEAAHFLSIAFMHGESYE